MMRNALALVVAVLLSLPTFAQINLNDHYSGGPVFDKPINADEIMQIRQQRMANQLNNPDGVGVTSFTIDYDVASLNNESFIWQIGSQLGCQDTFTLRRAVVTYDTLHDAAANIGYIWADSIVTVDSIFMAVGHVNNSGTTDSIVVKIINLSNQGYPLNNTVWYESVCTDTSITGQSSTSWLQAGILGFAPNVTLPAGVPFGVRVEYYGADIDTFGMIAGFIDSCFGACAANRGPFYPSSYYFLNYPGLCQFYPSLSGAGIFLDCNSNGQTDLSACEDFYIQNWWNWVVVSLNKPLELARVGAEGNNTGCSGSNSLNTCDDVTLYAQASGGTPPYTYSWMPTTGLDNASSQTPVASVSDTTTYTVTITDADNNTVMGSTTVNFNGITVNAGLDVTIPCNGSATVQPTLGGVIDGFSFLWNTGATSANITVDAPGTYSVTVSNSNGCSAVDAVNIDVQGTNQVVSYFPPSGLCVGAAFTFLNTSVNTNGWTWSWDFGDGNTDNLANGTNTFAAVGMYTVTLTGDSAGCTISYSQDFNVQVCIGVEDINLNDALNVYPNPTSGLINIDFNNLDLNNTNIEIYNIQGQVVYGEFVDKLATDRMVIDLNDAPNGLYLIRVSSDEGIATRKISISRN